MLKFSLKALRLGKRFRRDETGTSAIEFAIVGPIIIALLLSVIEMSYLFTKIALLNHSLRIAARSIYVGAASAGDISIEDLEKTICDNIVIGGKNCEKNLLLELTEITSLTDLPDTMAECEYTDLEISPIVTYTPGGSSSTVLMRACFVTDILTPGIGFGLSLPEVTDGKFSIIGSIAFVNEPF